MGSNREEHSKQSETKVSIREVIGVDIDEIYIVWEEYNKMKLRGLSETEIIHQFRNYYPMGGIVDINSIMDYFLILGLELINAEIIKK